MNNLALYMTHLLVKVCIFW